MDLQYQLKAGSYCLYDMRETPSAITGERRCRLRTELVAIAFDLVTGQVHEHGSPTRIHAWAMLQRAGGKRLAAGDFLRGFDLPEGAVLDGAASGGTP